MLVVMEVEVVEAAVADARENARRAGVENVDFVAAPAEEKLPEMVREGLRPDVVVLDPPRRGCDPALIDTVSGSLAPQRVVYVSCDPATLARDLKLFSARGYAVQRVQPVDLFPRTAHVETVALLQRETEEKGSHESCL